MFLKISSTITSITLESVHVYSEEYFNQFLLKSMHLKEVKIIKCFNSITKAFLKAAKDILNILSLQIFIHFFDHHDITNLCLGFKNLKNFKNLKLHGYIFEEKILLSLLKCPLQSFSLHFDKYNVNENTLQYLHKLEELTTFEIFCSINDKILNSISFCQNLKILCIHNNYEENNELTLSAILNLKRLMNLKELHLNFFNDFIHLTLSIMSKNLNILTLDNSQDICDFGLINIFKLRKLKS